MYALILKSNNGFKISMLYFLTFFGSLIISSPESFSTALSLAARSLYSAFLLSSEAHFSGACRIQKH